MLTTTSTPSQAVAAPQPGQTPAAGPTFLVVDWKPLDHARPLLAQVTAQCGLLLLGDDCGGGTVAVDIVASCAKPRGGAGDA